MEKLTFNELMKEINDVPIFESRIAQPRMQEFVISTDVIMQLHLTLQKFFGEHFKAPGEAPTPAEKRIAARLGGVRSNQTMYYSEFEGRTNCALIWPWTDGSRCTVKIQTI